MTINGAEPLPRGGAAAAARPLHPRAGRPHRHARRLRHQPVRRLHHPPQRPGGEVVHAARGAGGRRPDHDHRGAGQGRRAPPDPGGLLGEARPAVRLLHAGHDHVRRTSCSSATRSRPRTQIRHQLEGNLCRCTGYHNIVKAIQYAAEKMAEEVEGGRPWRPAELLGRQVDQAPRGPALHHRQGQLHRRPQAARHDLRRLRAQPARPRADPQDRHRQGRRRTRAWSRSSPART